MGVVDKKKLQVTSCRLQVAGYKLQVAGYNRKYCYIFI